MNEAFRAASRYYPVPMVRSASACTIRLDSNSLDLSAQINYGLRETDGCCGAWNLWLPEVTISNRSSFRKSVDLDAALGEHRPKNRAEFREYCWIVLCNSIFSYVIGTHRNGLFAQDGARKVVDELMRRLPHVKHCRPVYINQHTNLSGNKTVSGLDPKGETGTRRLVVDMAWATRAKVQKSTFLSAHGTYQCNGYVVDFGATKPLKTTSWYLPADNAKVYSAYMEKR